MSLRLHPFNTFLGVCRRNPFSRKKRVSDPIVFGVHHRLFDKLLATMQMETLVIALAVDKIHKS